MITEILTILGWIILFQIFLVFFGLTLISLIVLNWLEKLTTKKSTEIERCD
jgi:hypothetical protein